MAMKKLTSLFKLIFSKDYFLITVDKGGMRVANYMPPELLTQSGKSFYLTPNK